MRFQTSAEAPAGLAAPPREPVRAALGRIVLKEILDGRFPAGGPLNMVDLARSMRVSVTPLREALIELQERGFVEAPPGKGFVVRPLEAREVEEIYPIVWTLETLALRSNPPAGADLEALAERNERLAEALDDPHRALELDTAWHEALLARSDNETLRGLLWTFKQRVARYEIAYLRDSGRMLVSVEHHRRILAALRTRDLDEAAATLVANWQSGPEYLLPWLDQRARH